MTTTVEVYAVDFFRLIEAKPITKFCDVCSRRFIRTTYYRHIKSKVHLATVYKKPFQVLLPLINERVIIKNYKCEDVCNENIQKNYEQLLKSEKNISDRGEVRRIHSTICNTNHLLRLIEGMEKQKNIYLLQGLNWMW